MLAHLFSADTPFFIQGMTGKEGRRMAAWLVQSGARVLAGVTPGRSGEQVEGRPIFSSVQEARALFPEVDVSTVVVPAPRALEAVEEALSAGITCIHIFTEGIPVHDARRMRERAQQEGATILGPSSVGYLQFPSFRLGYLGGENPWNTLIQGGIGLLSTSGGMLNELLMGFSRANIGIRCALAVGGDRFPTTSLEEASLFFDGLPEVEQLVVFLEPGRSFIQSLLLGKIRLTKPLILFLAGERLDLLPRGQAYGHVGTLLGEGEPSMHILREGLRQRGIHFVSSLEECIQALSHK